MHPGRPSQSTTAISFVWALAPVFTCGFATPFTIAYAAYRKRAPMIAVAAMLYFLSLFVMFVLIVAYDSVDNYPDWAGLLIVVGLFTNWIGGPIHSLAIRTTVFAPGVAAAAPYPPPRRDHHPAYAQGPYPQRPASGPYPQQNHAPHQRPGQNHAQSRPHAQRRPEPPYHPGAVPPRHPGPGQDSRPPWSQHQRPQDQPQRPPQDRTRFLTQQHQGPADRTPQNQGTHDRGSQNWGSQDRAPQNLAPQDQGRYPLDGRPQDTPSSVPPSAVNAPVAARVTAPGPSGSRDVSTIPTQAPGPLPAGEPDRIGRYRLIGSLGQGGQGSVYLGETPDGTRVAIKILHARLAAENGAQQRFLREVEAARRVAPFSTARVIDADVADERLFIVSEYVEGASLEQLVRDRGPRGHDGLVRLALGTAGALAAIHRAGIVHRDFKPSNVLIGADGPRVVDFGIARVLDNATATGSGVLGTPAYMSPEQVSGERVGPESDIFSWAATMVFAATGRPAFGEDNIAAVFHRIFTKQPDLSALPEALARVVGTCLDKRPENRPSASDVMLAIVQ
ncbi:protein kinase [Sphaerisporangium sp. NPDC005289]|uniref:protein kinase domain-containing protein n=1 Tax=Sphaerisporangium sp. NPDC005289 TaxID=3155247 RepID=UPI0033A51F2F